MKAALRLVLLCLLFSSTAGAQGIIRGKITDENGEAIIGATVVKKSDPAVGTITDLDGNYSIKIAESAPQILIISFISYDKLEIAVNPSNNEVLIRNFTLLPSARSMQVVEIEAKAIRSNDQYMENMKKKSATTMDFISSETMKKTGDANVSAAVARVTGVSTNGGFITVRGIGDRYVKTAINGSRIPTLDPFTNNIRLDMFPASLVDNILITKTASPDLPGDWAGAYLSVETKDFPDQLTVQIESTFGYNPQNTFKDMLSAPRSSTDWMGYDSNRDYDHTKFIEANPSPTQFEELKALGLGDYYASIGVTQSWVPGTAAGDTYFKLGLVQLGLLPAALFNDPSAVASAKNAFETGSYHSLAFRNLNESSAASAKDFKGQWDIIRRQAPLNFSQSISIGNQKEILKRTFGFLAGFRYYTSTFYDADAMASRVAVNDEGSTFLASDIREEVARESNGWSALFNASCKLNNNNSVSLLFMPNVSGVNNSRNSKDYVDPVFYSIRKAQFYEERRQFIYQLKSDNYLPSLNLRFETVLSYTDGTSKAPDFKTIAYQSNLEGTSYSIGGERAVNRFFRYLNDDVFDGRFSIERPFNNQTGLVRKIKAGAAWQYNRRQSDQYDYFIIFGPKANPVLASDDLNLFFDPSGFGIREGVADGIPYSTLDMYYGETGTPSNFIFGNSEIRAAYVMSDYAINKRIRVSGGVRIEDATMFTDAVLYDSLGYSDDDPRRRFGTDIFALKPGRLEEVSILPSLNVIYTLSDSLNAPVNVRLNYSRTVARPSLREISDMIVFDYELRAFVFGNSGLKIVDIDNYDLRLEKYFVNGDNISVSAFYKQFTNHIEVTDAPQGYSWENVDASWVKGIEIEGRKVITKAFDIRANITLVKSETNYIQRALLVNNGIKDYSDVGPVRRTMFGQAPWILNFICNYEFKKAGVSTTLSYNVQGPRLVISAFNRSFEVYEQPRHMVDFKCIKKLGKRFSTSLMIRDLLNSPVIRSYNFKEGRNYDYDSFRMGTNISLSLSYKI